MNSRDADVDRLLRGAAFARDEGRFDFDAPFGFDTRVVALWRAQGGSHDFAVLGQWLRRTAAVAVFIAAIASAGAYWAIDDTDDLNSPLAAADSLADQVIERGALP